MDTFGGQPVTVERLGAVGLPDIAMTNDVLDHFNEAVIVLASEDHVLMLNAAARRLLPELTLGQPVPALGAIGQALRGSNTHFEVKHGKRTLQGRKVTMSGSIAWYVTDVTRSRETERLVAVEHTRTLLLRQCTERLSGCLNRDRAARTSARLAVPVLGDAVVILLAEPDNQWSWFCYSHGGDTGSGSLGSEELGLARALLSVMRGAVAEDDPRLPDQVAALSEVIPLDMEGLGHVTVAALPGFGAPVGIVIALRRFTPGDGAPDRLLLTQYAAQTGAAIASAALFQKQARLTEQLRGSLRPRRLAKIRGVTTSTFHRPAQEPLGIGGDFYHAVDAGAGRTLLAFGEVCGKGVEAATRLAVIRQAINGLPQLGHEPAQWLAHLNGELCRQRDAWTATLVLALLETAPQGHIDITVGSAGHPPPLLVRAGRQVEVIDPGPVMLGFHKTAVFAQTHLRLWPKDAFVIYSDGVINALGGLGDAIPLGVPRLSAALAAFGGTSARVIAERIDMTATGWVSSDGHDDLMALVLYAQPGRPGQNAPGG